MSVDVLVLGGGPDAEREVSLRSAAGVAEALRGEGLCVESATIDRPSAADLARLPGRVVFPLLHGAYGEGGPLQDLLEGDGRAYVGCGPRAARLAMDKLATKATAWRLGIPTAEACALNPEDSVCPLALPVVLKPVHEGSSVGLRIVRTPEAYAEAAREARQRGSVTMVESLTPGRELTVGLAELGDDGLRALPVVEIVPASGVYDYAAKYERDDTRYIAEPELPDGIGASLCRWSLQVARALGVRHLGRVDFMLDSAGRAWLLELNTMPGFTRTSLLPMAAQAAGVSLGALCAGLVRRAALAWETV